MIDQIELPPPAVLHHIGIEHAPWAMEPHVLDDLLACGWVTFDSLIRGDTTAAEIQRIGRLPRIVRRSVHYGVGHIRVQRPLVRADSLMSRSLHLNSYETIAHDLCKLVEDDKVKAILLEVIETPGGELRGCGDLATAIFHARERKPVHALLTREVSGAGFWLASAAQHITVDAEAVIGKLGVTMAVSNGDGTGRYALSGALLDPAGGAVSPDRQKVVNALGDVMIGSIARYRGLSLDHVADAIGHGRVLRGQGVVDASLADEVGTYESAPARLK